MVPPPSAAPSPVTRVARRGAPWTTEPRKREPEAERASREAYPGAGDARVGAGGPLDSLVERSHARSPSLRVGGTPGPRPGPIFGGQSPAVGESRSPIAHRRALPPARSHSRPKILMWLGAQEGSRTPRPTSPARPRQVVGIPRRAPRPFASAGVRPAGPTSPRRSDTPSPTPPRSSPTSMCPSRRHASPQGRGEQGSGEQGREERRKNGRRSQCLAAYCSGPHGGDSESRGP